VACNPNFALTRRSSGTVYASSIGTAAQSGDLRHSLSRSCSYQIRNNQRRTQLDSASGRESKWAFCGWRGCCKAGHEANNSRFSNEDTCYITPTSVAVQTSALAKWETEKVSTGTRKPGFPLWLARTLPGGGNVKVQRTATWHYQSRSISAS